MSTLADMLLGRATPAPIPPKRRVRPRKLKPRVSIKPESAKVMGFYEHNSNKPCSVPGCNEPRHRAKSGRCHTTKCTKHYRAESARYRS